jgi:hypothetical protein
VPSVTLGDVVSFSFFNHIPVISRIRQDVVWTNVIDMHRSDSLRVRKPSGIIIFFVCLRVKKNYYVVYILFSFLSLALLLFFPRFSLFYLVLSCFILFYLVFSCFFLFSLFFLVFLVFSCFPSFSLFFLCFPSFSLFFLLSFSFVVFSGFSLFFLVFSFFFLFSSFPSFLLFPSFYLRLCYFAPLLLLLTLFLYFVFQEWHKKHSPLRKNTKLDIGRKTIIETCAFFSIPSLSS